MKPVRHPLQLHLSTVVYLSLAAGTFMLVNTLPQHKWGRPFCDSKSQPITQLQTIGYPYPFLWTWVDNRGENQSYSIFSFLVLNGIVGLNALIVLAIFCEWSLRRAERRRCGEKAVPRHLAGTAATP